MKILIASDIHGSSLYCRGLLQAYKSEAPDRLLLLGDILYHGPRNDLPEEYAPKKVIEMLNNISDNILSVRGNCDTEVDQMVLNFPIMAEYCLLYAGSRAIFASHGHIYGRNNPPHLKRGDILLNGHTHVSCIDTSEAFIYANPGSVSIPKENTPRGYMLLTEKGLYAKKLDGEKYMEYIF